MDVNMWKVFITGIFILIVLYLIIKKYPDQFKRLTESLSKAFGYTYSGLADQQTNV